MGQSNKFKGIGSITPFQTIAWSYGMTPEDAEDVLSNEFSRRHKGSKFKNYVLRWTWETLRGMKELKKLSDYEIQFRHLPMLEKIALEKEHKVSAKEWQKIADKAYEERLVKNYHKRINRIAGLIRRVNNKDYKNWVAYYELIKPVNDAVEEGLNFNGPPNWNK